MHTANFLDLRMTNDSLGKVRLLQSLDLFVCQINVNRAYNNIVNQCRHDEGIAKTLTRDVFQVLEVRRPNDRSSHYVFRQAPSNSNLRHANATSLGDLLNSGTSCEYCGHVQRL